MNVLIVLNVGRSPFGNRKDRGPNRRRQARPAGDQAGQFGIDFAWRATLCATLPARNRAFSLCFPQIPRRFKSYLRSFSLSHGNT